MVAYITELNSTNYEELTKDGVWLVDIWAPWCTTCKQLSPIIDDFSSETLGKVNVGKINADENQEMVMNMGVRSLPTILVYKNGEIVDRNIGLITKIKLMELVNNYI